MSFWNESMPSWRFIKSMMVSNLGLRASDVSWGGRERERKRQRDEPLVRIVHSAQGDVFLVLEQAVEIGVVAVELEFGEDESHVGADEGAVAFISNESEMSGARRGEMKGREDSPRETSPPTVRAQVSSHPVWFCASLRVCSVRINPSALLLLSDSRALESPVSPKDAPPARPCAP